jgi:hypothetical protein
MRHNALHLGGLLLCQKGGDTMPTVNQLLTDIDRRFPNTFSQADKIDWLNEVQDEVFREAAIHEILEIDTISDVPFYELRDEDEIIEFEMVKVLTVDNKEYEPADITQDSRSNIFYKILDYNNSEAPMFGIYPTPTVDGKKIRIFYERRPTPLSVSNLNAIPDLKEDYQVILKYGVWIIIAEAMDDIVKANNYTLRYNAEMKKIKQERYEKMAKYPSTKDVMTKRHRVSEVYNV